MKSTVAEEMSRPASVEPALAAAPHDCPYCHGQLMRVQRRPIAGGLQVWAAISVSSMALGTGILMFARQHGWPFGVSLFLLGLWLSLHRFSRWQCRRCRSLFRVRQSRPGGRETGAAEP